MSRPVFVSFHCGDPYYARAGAALRARCDTLGIPLLIEGVADRGSYWRNTLQKPLFIRDMLDRLRRDLFWIDVDTNLHADHPAFHAVKADLAVASHSGDISGVKASPIGFAYNARSLAFVTDWAETCRARLDSGEVDLDHDILKYEILPRFPGRITIDLMGDAIRPREFTEGRILTNGLSGRGRDALPIVIARNRSRAARFAGLSLHDFAALDCERPEAVSP